MSIDSRSNTNPTTPQDTRFGADKIPATDSGGATAEELQGKIDEMIAANARRKSIGGGTIAALALVGGGIFVGSKMGGDSEPTTSSQPVIEAPDTELPIDQVEEPSLSDYEEIIPGAIENYEVPPEAQEWIDAYGDRFIYSEALKTYWADMAHEEKFGYTSTISDTWLENYEPTTNVIEGQLIGLRQLEIPVDADITNPDTFTQWLNSGVPNAVESYLNIAARNPNAIDTVREEFRITVGGANSEDTERMINELDHIVAANGSNSVFHVRQFELIPGLADDPTEDDPSTIRFRTDDPGRLSDFLITVYDDYERPQGIQVPVNMAIEIETFGAIGDSINKVERLPIVISAERLSTNSFHSTSVDLGKGARISTP